MDVIPGHSASISLRTTLNSAKEKERGQAISPAEWWEL